jgi:3-dehydroquinate dehydratase I
MVRIPAEGQPCQRQLRARRQDMMGQNSVKKGAAASRLVGVVASPEALGHAMRLRRPPDFFELRLDALRNSLGEVTRAIPKLRAPLILTARHPAERGHGGLNLVARQALLERFLDHAAFIDLELRSGREMKALIRKARQRHVGLILSWHDFHDTPARAELVRKTKSAAAAGAAIFKIATRTDKPAQLARLISFFETTRATLPIAAMGMGKLGLASRRQLAQLGSALNYVSLGKETIEGQPSLSQLRRTRSAYV